MVSSLLDDDDNILIHHLRENFEYLYPGLAKIGFDDPQLKIVVDCWKLLDLDGNYHLVRQIMNGNLPHAPSSFGRQLRDSPTVYLTIRFRTSLLRNTLASPAPFISLPTRCPSEVQHCAFLLRFGEPTAMP